MKRTVAAIALIVLAAGISLWSGYTFKKQMEYFETELTELLGAADSDLPEKAEKIVSDWENKSVFLHSFLIHDGIDELEQVITSLPMILEYSGRDEFNIRCIEGINLIKNLKACEKLSVENVL